METVREIFPRWSMKKTSIIAACAVILTMLSFSPLLAQGVDYKYVHSAKLDVAYYPATHRGYGLGDKSFAHWNYDRLEYDYWEPGVTNGRNDVGNSFVMELKAYYKFQMEFPVLQGDGPLTKGNNVKLDFIFNVSPVTADAGVHAHFTPIAFLIFSLGQEISTGWYFPGLDLDGLAVNPRDAASSPDMNYADYESFTKHPDNDGFNGILSKTEMGMTFQFDLAAVVPGDWTHVVVVANWNFLYRYYSKSTNEDTRYWRFEHDKGENENGFTLEMTYLLGYQMPKRPARINLVGFIVETDQRLTGMNASKMDDGGWGSDFIEVKFGPMVNFIFGKYHSLTFLAQFKNGRHYTDATFGHRDFRNRQVDTSNPQFVQFDRFALSYSYKFGHSPNYF